MMYLEIVGGEVRLWLNHSPEKAERHSFDDVLGGALDGEVGSVFGGEVLSELKAAVREQMINPPKPFDKQADMLRRRREA
jgi:hypothetical protein